MTPPSLETGAASAREVANNAPHAGILPMVGTPTDIAFGRLIGPVASAAIVEGAMYTWMVFVHLVGVFGFLLAHGVSAAVAWRLRTERDPAALRAVLALSASTRTLMYTSLALLLVGGIAAGVIGHWWGSAWLWAAVALLILVTAAALVLALTYFRRLRRQLMRDDAAPGTAPAPSLGALLGSPAPVLLSVVGLAGLLAILWLMVFKPG